MLRSSRQTIKAFKSSSNVYSDMNRFYDIEAARKEIAAVSEESTSRDTSTAAHIGTVKVDELKVATTKYPPSTRLYTSHEGEDEEVVMRLQGVLCGKFLPPVQLNNRRINTTRLRNLRQQVKITGFGDETFDSIAVQLRRIQAMFQDALPGSTVGQFEAIPHEGHFSVDSHARYFTDRGLVPYEKNNDFFPFVDPTNVLRNLQPDTFIHGSDNQVEYCVLEVDSEGQRKYRPLNPATLKVGDLVEIAFSCVAIPIKNNKHMCMLLLRAVTLLSSRTRIESERQMAAADNPAPMSRPKRKTMFLEESDVENTRKRLHAMSISTS